MRRVRFVLAGLSLAAVAAGAVEGRAPVPEAAAQQKALLEIKQILKDDYAKTAKADRQAVAAKLQQMAVETPNDPVSRWVLFQEAIRMAEGSGDPVIVSAAYAKIAELYAVDDLAMREEALTKSLKAAGTLQTPDGQRALALGYLELAGAALSAERFEAVSRLAGLAQRAADECGKEDVAAKVRTGLREIADIHAGLGNARDRLKGDALHAESNLIVGKFLCFWKGDWTAGLPHLSRGSDPLLKDIAQKEMADPQQTPAQFALASLWWEFAEKQTGILAQKARLKAVALYRLLLPVLTGLDKARAESRLKEIEAKAAAAEPATAATTAPAAATTATTAPATTPATTPATATTEPAVSEAAKQAALDAYSKYSAAWEQVIAALKGEEDNIRKAATDTFTRTDGTKQQVANDEKYLLYRRNFVAKKATEFQINSLWRAFELERNKFLAPLRQACRDDPESQTAKQALVAALRNVQDQCRKLHQE